MEQMLGTTSPDRKKVFIIHGRNDDARTAVERFLTSLKLVPWTFEQIARDLGMQEHTSDIVRKGMEQAHGIVVVFTPDEHAILRTALQRPTDDEVDCKRWQARPNVIFEAGMAYGLAPERTILAVAGRPTKLFSDVAGIPYIELGENQNSRERFRDRLMGIKCAVDPSTRAWVDVNLSFGSLPDDVSAIQQTSTSPASQDVQLSGSSQGIDAIGISLYICNKQTGKFVDLTNWAREDRVGIQQFEWHGGENQVWILKPVSNRYVTIHSKHSHKYLTVPDDSKGDDVQIVQLHYTGAKSQQWKPDKYDDGSFSFSNRLSGKFLHVQDGNLDNSAHIVQKHWPQGNSQKWLLQLAALL